MKEKMNKLIKVFFTKQFLFFLIVGGINTVNGMIFPTIFKQFMDPNLAFVIGYIPCLTISYFLNSFITFRDKKVSFAKYIKFVISYMPNFLIQFLTFSVVFNMLHWPHLLAILIASAIGIPVTFLIMKFYAFRKKNENM